MDTTAPKDSRPVMEAQWRVKLIKCSMRRGESKDTFQSFILCKGENMKRTFSRHLINLRMQRNALVCHMRKYTVIQTNMLS